MGNEMSWQLFLIVMGFKGHIAFHKLVTLVRALLGIYPGNFLSFFILCRKQLQSTK